MKNKATFSLLFFILPFLLQAQLDKDSTPYSCITDQLHDKMLDENSSYASQHELIEQEIYNLTNRPETSYRKMDGHTIPVVVHIVHDGGPANISDEQVHDAMRHLNEAFANEGHYDPSTGVDIDIDFCLATRDPENYPSDGITRTESSLTDMRVETEDLLLKSNQWSPEDYMNIWVVNEVSSGFGSGVAAYAYFPAVHGLPQDGIVIEHKYFGTSPDSSKVLVHEVGHYLGIYHTFKGGCTNDDCLVDGDRICDTPPDQSTVRTICGETINTCTTDEDDTSTNNPFRSTATGGLGDQNDMFINYMDYSSLPCYSAFTEGQKGRMNNVLTTTRQSLVRSFGCIEPCPFSSYEAAFDFDSSTPIFAGNEVQFTNNSDAANYYEWRIDGQIFSNERNSRFLFDREGQFTISLLVRDTINYCESRVEQTIDIVCEGAASFVTESRDVFDGETTMTFRNTSTSHDSYEWYLDGTLYSTDRDISITFSEAGYYTLYLVGVTASCSNNSTPLDIDILGCSGPDYNLENHWHFGEYGGLDFNGGDPVPIYNSELSVYRGSASISDDDGNLLFYTDGFSVWDASNTVMPNGSDLQIIQENGLPLPDGSILFTGDGSWGPIIPRPYHPSQYYIFSYDWVGSATTGQYVIKYSIVDMTLNGGLGDVTDEKSIVLGPTNGYTMDAAYHADGENVWLVHRSDAKVLSTYLIDSTGINLPVHYRDDSDINNTTFSKGLFFNSGKRLILKRFNYSNGDEHLVVFDFDNVTGTLSNPIAFLPHENKDYRVLDFVLSPDDRKLYTISTEGDLNEPGIDQAALYQFYLPLAMSDQVDNSRTRIKKMTHLNHLGLGPNGKIYVSNIDESANGTEFLPPTRQYMGVIHDPNKSGVDCNYEHQAFSILPGSNWNDFPEFIKGKGFKLGVIEPTIDLGPDLKICNGATVTLNPEGREDLYYLWHDGSTDPSYTTWGSGNYSVTVSNECGSVTDDINIEIDYGLLDLGEDIVTRFTPVTLIAGDYWDNYIWNNGSTDSRLTVTEPGEYWVDVTTDEGCFQSDTISVAIEIPNNLYKSSLIVYPNPSDGLFILKEKGRDIINDLSLTVYDPLGHLVYEQSALLEGQMEIDLTEYPDGIYFLHWTSFNDSGMFKLIIQSP